MPHRTTRMRSRSPFMSASSRLVIAPSTLAYGTSSPAHYLLTILTYRTRYSASRARAVHDNAATAPRRGMAHPGSSDHADCERHSWPLDDQDSDYETSGGWHVGYHNGRARDQCHCGR